MHTLAPAARDKGHIVRAVKASRMLDGLVVRRHEAAGNDESETATVDEKELAHCMNSAKLEGARAYYVQLWHAKRG